MKVTRRTAREWAVQMLTAADLNPPEKADDLIRDYWYVLSDSRPSAGLRSFAEERVRGVLDSREAIDAALAPHMDGWAMDRLGTVERSVLRLAAWELTYTDIPRAVVLNEAIDLVNWFSTPRSRTLVNAILDKFVHAAK